VSPSHRGFFYAFTAAVAAAAGLGVAYGADRDGLTSATFALALGAALGAAGAILETRAGRRSGEALALRVEELADLQRRAREDAAGGRPEPRVLFLEGEAGVTSLRVERRRPRPLDLEETVAHERTLALRTLPPAKAALPGSLRIYREPTEGDRTGFREQVEQYAAELRAALEQYDAYRQERALLVGGRFRFENDGGAPAHNVTVRVVFPDPFEVAGEPVRPPELPARPTFRARRAALAALLGHEARGPAGSRPHASPPRAGPVQAGNVSRPSYARGSATVEVRVETLRVTRPADMEEQAGWVLRLPRAGSYALLWEATGDELAEPVRGELRLVVVDLLDDTPIRSIGELVAEAG
jgi:hypothetical protein